jgi:putative adhesin
MSGRARISPVSRAFGLLVAALGGLLLVAAVGAGVVWADGFTVSLSSHHVYRVGGAPAVSIHAGAADLRVLPGADGQVTVDDSGFARTLTRELARSVSSGFRERVTQGGGGLDLELGGGGFVGPWAVSQGRTVVVRVPASTRLRAATGFGDVQLVGVRVTAPSQVSADEGDVSLDSVSVESSLTVRTSLGNVDFRGRVGRAGTLQVTTVSGSVDLTLPATTDAQAVVRHRGGNVSWDPVWHFGSRTVGGGQAWVGDLSSSPTGRIAVSCGFGNVSINAA